jgi:hypothetical protein
VAGGSRSPESGRSDATSIRDGEARVERRSGVDGNELGFAMRGRGRRGLAVIYEREEGGWGWAS